MCSAIEECDLGRLVAVAVPIRVEPGRCFIAEGDVAEHFFNVTGGTAKLFKLLPDGRRNRYRVDRLKDKLGTRAMATGEVTLEGAHAELVGELDRGFAQMTSMLNVTRLHNSIASAGTLRRGLQLARGYARAARRSAGRSTGSRCSGRCWSSWQSSRRRRWP